MFSVAVSVLVVKLNSRVTVTGLSEVFLTNDIEDDVIFRIVDFVVVSFIVVFSEAVESDIKFVGGVLFVFDGNTVETLAIVFVALFELSVV